MSEYYQHRSEKESITAADLLDAQEAVKANERRQDEAWSALKEAEQAVPRADQVYEGARWDAEVARADLKSLEAAIREQANNA